MYKKIRSYVIIPFLSNLISHSTSLSFYFAFLLVDRVMSERVGGGPPWTHALERRLGVGELVFPIPCVGKRMEWGRAPHRRPFRHPKHGPKGIGQTSSCEKGKARRDALSSHQTHMPWYDGGEVCQHYCGNFELHVQLRCLDRIGDVWSDKQLRNTHILSCQVSSSELRCKFCKSSNWLFKQVHMPL